ncbi:hypothetical protein GCM10023063_15540 [Arthrobacter methylotrophus]|uniref:Uncharacterized protein n=1 Tax=Arthrobacter methylotrophus TaxID=121291 RepID=A0ABV5UN74_9MICC
MKASPAVQASAFGVPSGRSNDPGCVGAWAGVVVATVGTGLGGATDPVIAVEGWGPWTGPDGAEHADMAASTAIVAGIRAAYLTIGPPNRLSIIVSRDAVPVYGYPMLQGTPGPLVVTHRRDAQTRTVSLSGLSAAVP